MLSYGQQHMTALKARACDVHMDAADKAHNVKGLVAVARVMLRTLKFSRCFFGKFPGLGLDLSNGDCQELHSLPLGEAFPEVPHTVNSLIECNFC